MLITHTWWSSEPLSNRLVNPLVRGHPACRFLLHTRGPGTGSRPSRYSLVWSKKKKGTIQSHQHQKQNSESKHIFKNLLLKCIIQQKAALITLITHLTYSETSVRSVVSASKLFELWPRMFSPHDFWQPVLRLHAWLQIVDCSNQYFYSEVPYFPTLELRRPISHNLFSGAFVSSGFLLSHNVTSGTLLAAGSTSMSNDLARSEKQEVDFHWSKTWVKPCR